MLDGDGKISTVIWHTPVSIGDQIFLIAKKKGMSYVYGNPSLQRRVFEKKLVVVRLTIENYWLPQDWKFSIITRLTTEICFQSPFVMKVARMSIIIICGVLTYSMNMTKHVKETLTWCLTLNGQVMSILTT